ncbi:unnamed protein product, partial [Heterosigma akashiwo]
GCWPCRSLCPRRWRCCRSPPTTTGTRAPGARSAAMAVVQAGTPAKYGCSSAFTCRFGWGWLTFRSAIPPSTGTSGACAAPGSSLTGPPGRRRGRRAAAAAAGG